MNFLIGLTLGVLLMRIWYGLCPTSRSIHFGNPQWFTYRGSASLQTSNQTAEESK